MSSEDRIEKKLDNISRDIVEIKETLAAKKVSDHDLNRRTAAIEADIIPIKKHVFMIQGSAKLLLLLSLVAGIAEALFLILKH